MKNTYLRFSAVVVAVIALLPSLHAAPKSGPPPKQKPDTVSAVSADSISVKHTKNLPPVHPGGKPREESSTKTYKITTFTSVTIDNQMAKVADLKEGMAVTVSSEATSTPQDGINGVATQIAAHTAK